jgi:hypothetical protein
MREYTVTLFGEIFKIEADSDYDARREAAIKYRQEHGGPEPLVYLRSKTSIKVSEKWDKRVKYPIMV